MLLGDDAWFVLCGDGDKYGVPPRTLGIVLGSTREGGHTKVTVRWFLNRALYLDAHYTLGPRGNELAHVRCISRSLNRALMDIVAVQCPPHLAE